ncbi:MAG: HDOD domain-containing protein [Sedimentisphaerales bacterium]|nr:HDOD domain-containing protein [Sedimentisphaerales bacterium]
MPHNSENATAAAQQVELIINRLDHLSTLACIAAKLIPKLSQSQVQLSVLIDIIESDPALTSRILSLIGQHNIILPDGRFSLVKALDKLPAHEVRNSILSIKVSQDFGEDNDTNADIISRKKGLLLHSIAVANCAKEIAETASPRMDPQLAYYAGLLHDIGKLALDETMPKSYARILDQARAAGKDTYETERENLGTDHTIIGKRLAQKWRFPNLIETAVWLHHSPTVTISHDMPQARIASVVQLADSIARQIGLGWSGSFGSPEPTEPIARELSITSEQLDHLRQQLCKTVEKKSQILGLELPGDQKKYSEILHETTAQFARRETELTNENRRLQSASSHLNFIKDLLLGVNSATTVLDTAVNLAIRWQRFYQTGRICLFWEPTAGSQVLEAVTVENLAQCEIISINAPVEISVIPEPISNNFAIVNAHDYLDWMFEQLDISFDENQTKLLPLLYGGRAIGAIAFELHYPGDMELFEESFGKSASIAGTVLGMLISIQRQQQYSERFANLISSPKEIFKAPEPPKTKNEPSRSIPADISIKALAEMAAGAAHELNNPLAVISGRAQLLSEAESNLEKKQILEQIHENANEASEIIEDLMIFAEPPLPRPTQTKIAQLIDESIQLAGRKTKIEEMDIQIKIAEGLETVFVDSAQIVSAIANIITNAAESYGGNVGPIEITAESEPAGNMIQLSIRDNGVGMDAQTLQKATQPFFSARPAGRKRGMGLAYTARLVQLNNGLLKIESEPGLGTNVKVCLPCQ